MSVIGSNALAGASGQGSDGFIIEKSLKFDENDTPYLNKTFSSTSSSFTVSFWMKLGRADEAGGYDHIFSCSGNDGSAYDFSVSMYNNTIYIYNGSHNNSTGRLLRDPAAWYHIVCSVNSNTATLYVNNEQVQQVTGCKYGGTCHIGNWAGSGYHFDGYLAEVQFVDGEALAPGDFAEYDDNNNWQAKKFSGSYNFTPTVTYPAVYVSSPGAYGAVTDVNTVNGNVFTSAGSTGASGSIRVEFASAITGVTHVKFKGGGYALSSGFSIKVNGSTTHTGLSTNSSYAVRTETLSSATDITSFEIVSTNDGWALGDLQFSTDGTNFTAPSGTAAVIPSAGVNGFHLDFAGNNFGTDNSGNNNNWTVNNLSSGVYSGTKPKWYTSTTLYTTKSDVVANATDRGQSAFTLSSEEFVYLVPNDGGAVGELCHPTGSQYPALFYVYVRSSGDTSWYNTGSHGATEAGTFQWENTTGTPQAYDYTKTEDLYLVGDTRNGGQPDAASKMSGSFPALVNFVAQTDALPDSPTNGDADDDTGAGGEVIANYCTMNPLANYLTLTNGNLEVSQSSAVHHSSFGTIGVSSGKWYWEITKNDGNNSAATSIGLGVANAKYTLDSQYFSSTTYDTFIGYMQSGVGLYDGSDSIERTVTALGSGVEHTTGTWMLAFDFDAGKGWIGKDGTWLSDTTAGNEGNPATGANPCFDAFVSGETYVPLIGMYAATSVTANFGQRAFAYSAPSGFKALCTANLTQSDVPDSSDCFDVKTYTGSGGLELASTSLNTSTAYRHHRILCEGDNNGGSISEIQFFDASGLIDASDTNNAGSSVTSNSNQGLAAWTAFNGTLGGSSYSYGVRKDPSSGFYIAKDWGSGNTKTITAVKIWGVDSYAIAGNTSSTYIKLQGSNDGSTWTDLQEWDDSRTGSWTSSSSTQVAHTSDTTTTIGGYEFSPDLVWIKKRSGTSDHALFDTVRGATKRLYPNDTSNEDTLTDTLTAFNSDSFSLGTASDVNANGDTYVGWAWDAGNSTVSNTDGDITSSVRANTSAGFSIVKWTTPTWSGSANRQVGHGLNAAPEFIITKGISTTGSWYTYHKELDASNPNDYYITLNSTDTVNQLADSFGPDIPDSTTFGDRLLGFTENAESVAFCWTPVSGYSAFGKYLGNGNTNGPFVYTGFRPALVIVKDLSSSTSWCLWDSKRPGYNLTDDLFNIDNSNAEAAWAYIDILSNGFKVRGTHAVQNTNGDSYIYAAFAENPFQANGGLAR